MSVCRLRNPRLREAHSHKITKRSINPPHYGPEWRNISKAYECAFGSEVAETTERTQAISQENVFLKPICEQNSIV